jgi:hypothetical protein
LRFVAFQARNILHRRNVCKKPETTCAWPFRLHHKVDMHVTVQGALTPALSQQPPLGPGKQLPPRSLLLMRLTFSRA